MRHFFNATYAKRSNVVTIMIKLKENATILWINSLKKYFLANVHLLEGNIWCIRKVDLLHNRKEVFHGRSRHSTGIDT